MRKVDKRIRTSAFMLILLMALTAVFGNSFYGMNAETAVYAADESVVYVDVKLDSSITTHFNTLFTEGEFDDVIKMKPCWDEPFNIAVSVNGSMKSSQDYSVTCVDDSNSNLYSSYGSLNPDTDYYLLFLMADLNDIYKDFRNGNTDLVVRVNGVVRDDVSWYEKSYHWVVLEIPLGKPERKTANGWTKLSAVYKHDINSYLDDEWVNYWYYYEDGLRVTNDFRRDSKGWCYLGYEGRQIKLKWIQWWYDDNWYFIDQTGYMAANAWIHGSDWYYVKSNGAMAANEWVKYRGEWYYLKSNGAMAAKQWAKDSKGWMWLNASGKITKSEWVKYKGDWYYLKSNGYMATGWQKINGKNYYFNSSGIWVEAMR